jgi:hypothetical protein
MKHTEIYRFFLTKLSSLSYQLTVYTILKFFATHFLKF